MAASRLEQWRERYERIPLPNFEERFDVCVGAAKRAMVEYELTAALHWLGMAQVQVQSILDRQNVVVGKRRRP